MSLYARSATATAPPGWATPSAARTPTSTAETASPLGPALATLPEREQKIIAMRFHGNLTQCEIAARSASPRCTCPGCSPAP